MISRLRIPAWLLLLAFCAFFFLWKLSSFGLIGADEPRYAQIAREMLARRDWITPTLGGTAWLEKPPLYYWQATAAYAVFGVSDWAARIPSVLDASLLVFAVFLFLQRGRREAASDSGVMLACTAGIVGYARAASTDMPLAAMFTIALLAWYAWFENGSRKHLAIFYVSLALATLAKGPVAPALAVLILTAFAAARRDWRIFRGSLWIPGLLLFCACALPWYALVQIRNPQFFHVFFLEHNLARFSSNMFHHPEPFWYYLPVTFLGWVPWAIFIIASIATTLRFFRHNTDPLNIFLVVWILVVVVSFSASQSKLPGYILPAIPPGILLFANQRQTIKGRPNAWLLVPHSVVSGALVFSALVMRYVALQHGLKWSGSMSAPLAAAVVVAILVCAMLFRSAGSSTLRFATVVPAVITLAVALRLGAPALDVTLSARPVSEALAGVAPGNLPVAAVLISRETEFGLQFYRNQNIPRYELGQAPAGEHLVVARRGFRKAFSKNVPGRQIRYLGSFPAQKLEFYYVGP